MGWWTFLAGCAWIGSDVHDERLRDFPLDLRIASVPERLACDPEPVVVELSFSPAYDGVPLVHSLSVDGAVLSTGQGQSDLDAEGRPRLGIAVPELALTPGVDAALELTTTWPGHPTTETVPVAVPVLPLDDLSLAEALLVGSDAEVSLADPLDALATADPIGAISVEAWPTLALTLDGEVPGSSSWSARLIACPAGSPVDAPSCVPLDTTRAGQEVTAALDPAGELGCAGPIDLHLALDELPCAPARALPVASDLPLRGFDCDLDGDGPLGFGGFDCDDDDFDVTVLYWNADGDGDGYPVGLVSACESPGADWFPNDPANPGPDCDDTDPSVLGTQVWYVDADEDGLGGPPTPFPSCDPPIGAVEAAGDCDDTDPGVGTSQWYPDPDGDGAGSAAEAAVVQCDPPAPTGWARDNAWGCAVPGPSLDGVAVVGSLQAAIDARIDAGDGEAVLCAGGDGLGALTLTLDGDFTLRNGALDVVPLAGVPFAHRRVPSRTVGRNLTVDGEGILRLEGFDFGHALGASVSGEGGCLVAGPDVALELAVSRVAGCDIAGDGGGIRASHLTLDGTDVSGCSAEIGGGVRAETVVLVGSSVFGNTASDRGGGIAAQHVVADASSSVHLNTAASGGGLSVDPDGTVEGVRVAFNTAVRGGGIAVVDRGEVREGTVIEGNVADEDGGGLLCAPCLSGSGWALRIEDASIRDNYALAGGGGAWIAQSGTGQLLDMSATEVSGNTGEAGGVGVDGQGDVELGAVDFDGNQGNFLASGLWLGGTSTARIIGGSTTGGYAQSPAIAVRGAVELELIGPHLVGTNAGQGFGCGLGAEDQATVTLAEVRFEGNACTVAGGIFVGGDAVVTGSADLVGNHAYRGGAIQVMSGNLTLQDSEITGNTSTFGAVADIQGGALTLVDTSATDNVCMQFGVVHMSGGTFTADGVVWSDNSPQQLRGGANDAELPTDGTCDAEAVCIP